MPAFSRWSDGWYLYQLLVFKDYRQQGVATELMQRALQFAHRRPLNIWPSEFNDKPMSLKQLKAWYGRLEFVPCDVDERLMCYRPIKSALN